MMHTLCILLNPIYGIMKVQNCLVNYTADWIFNTDDNMLFCC